MFSRDRFGVKPLYWTTARGRLSIASEAKALLRLYPELRRPDERAMYEFLALGRIHATERSFYDGISVVPKATVGTLPAGRIEPDLTTFWQFPAPGGGASDGDPADAFAELLEDAVRIRMRSDVPVGISLSGGLDSTAVLHGAAASLERRRLAHGLHLRVRLAARRRLRGRASLGTARELEVREHRARGGAGRPRQLAPRLRARSVASRRPELLARDRAALGDHGARARAGRQGDARGTGGRRAAGRLHPARRTRLAGTRPGAGRYASWGTARLRGVRADVRSTQPRALGDAGGAAAAAQLVPGSSRHGLGAPTLVPRAVRRPRAAATTAEPTRRPPRHRPPAGHPAGAPALRRRDQLRTFDRIAAALPRLPARRALRGTVRPLEGR